MQSLTREIMDRLWPDGDDDLIDGMIATQAEAFALGEIDSTLRLTHFMTQISHECGGGTIQEENLNYSAARLTEVWPGRFPTLLAATVYEHNPRALANKTYGGRMGNKIGSDDGWNYRGRGLIQLTGHDAYYSVGLICDLDLLAHPEFVNDPKLALKVACASWKLANANIGADDDSLQRVTRAINGGLIGLPARQLWLNKWRAEFAPK